MSTASVCSRAVWWVLTVLVLATTSVSASAECINTGSYGSATINLAGDVVTISTCSFPGEYSTILSAVNGQTLRAATSIATDYITIRSGTYDGPVVAFGPTPLVFANTYTGNLYAHWSSDAMCGTLSACRVTTVQCTSCGLAAPLIFRDGFESIAPE